MKIKSTSKNDEKINKSLSNSTRLGFAIAGLAASLALIATAWWFLVMILQDPARQQLDIIGYLTMFGLVVSAALGIIASLLLGVRHAAFMRYARLACNIAFISVISVLLISALTYVPGSGAMQSLADAWLSFINFGRINLGLMSISTTGTLALIGVIALAVALAGRK